MNSCASPSKMPTEANLEANLDNVKVFVNGIPFGVDESEIREYFMTYGVVRDVRLVYDEFGRAKGFAFVTFDTPEEQNAALSCTDHVLNGRYMLVKPAFKHPGNNNKVFVGTLPMSATRMDIKAYFSQFGSVTNIYKPLRSVNSQRGDYCFVTFLQNDAVTKVMRATEHKLNNCFITVNHAYSKKRTFGMNLPPAAMANGGVVQIPSPDSSLPIAAVGALKKVDFKYIWTNPLSKSCPANVRYTEPDETVATLKKYLDSKERALTTFVKNSGYSQK